MAAASISNFKETYIGRDILVSYLQQHQDKSYLGFLFCSRDTIITSSMLFSASWISLDSPWLSRFLYEAKRLNPGDFTALNEKVKKERLRNMDHLENYLRSIIQECKKKRVLLEYEAERNRIYLALSEVNNKIQMTKIELAEIFNEWKTKKNLDFSRGIGDVFNEDIGRKFKEDKNSVFSGAAVGDEFDKEIGGDPNEEGNNSISPVDVLGAAPEKTLFLSSLNFLPISPPMPPAVGDEFYEEVDPNEEGNNNVSPGGLGPGDFDEDIGRNFNEEDKNSVFSGATVGDEFKEIGGGPNEEGNNSISPGTAVGGLGPRNLQRKINKRKRPTPSLTRKLNPRNLEWVNYNNVGPPSRKRHKKSVLQPPPVPSSSPSLHSLSMPSTHYLFA